MQMKLSLKFQKEDLMRSWGKTLLAAVALYAVAASPVLADQSTAPGQNKGAPGPIAGAGLPFLLLAGGYFMVNRYRNRSRAE